MKRHKILYGVCGIGNGHAYRQLPIIESLAADSSVVIFAYQTSLELLQKHFESWPTVSVIEVGVPYFPGKNTGLDFGEAADRSLAAGKDYVAINARAMAAADRLIGRPDLVITDYEPVSAQYAYAYDAPLVTIDQQSKYLSDTFPEALGGLRYADEVMRLRMFFPRADRRIACSFFNVVPKADTEFVIIIPPVLRDVVAQAPAQRKVAVPRTILVYISAQMGYRQSLEEICAMLGANPEFEFKLFVPRSMMIGGRPPQPNVTIYAHGSAEFDSILLECEGLIATAGHTLLSEAMHLGIPVYALPLPIYEQQMNAAVVAENGFGISAPAVDEITLAKFLKYREHYRKNISVDRSVLMRGDGKEAILKMLRAMLD